MNENYQLVETLPARGTPSIRSGMKVIGETRLFIRIEKETLEAFQRFTNSLERAMAKLYRVETGRRLPGSDRTARLRKKRRVKLERWFQRRRSTYPSPARHPGFAAAAFGDSGGGVRRR